MPAAMQTLPQRIRFARELRGFTQRELGRRASIPPTHVSTLEKRPGRRVEQDTVEKLAKALGVDAAWLGWGIGAPPKRIPPNRQKRAPAQRRAAAHVVRA